ncbi:MAG: capsule assembly Wzi family protein [Anaeromyxobacteraceae bacterium]
MHVRGPFAVAVLALASVTARAAAPCDAGAEVVIDGLDTPAVELLRTAELVGAAPAEPGVIRRAGARAAGTCAGAALPWALPAAPSVNLGPVELGVVPLRLASHENSKYPASGNDGLVWQGRGLSGMVSGGLRLRWGAVSAAILPELAASQNRDFYLPGNGLTGDLRWQNRYYGDLIDFPLRPGDRAFAEWSPGQSYLRVDAWNVGAGVSTENLWLGPGIRNTLLMTNAGPGFPHAFLGTSRPADVGIGKAEALLFWGRLERTRYAADRRAGFVTGLVLDYTPRWIPGLTVGAMRVFVQRWGDFTLHKLLPVSQGVTQQLEPDNQLASLFFRWAFPEAGLRIHAEWGRDDAEWSLGNYVNEPDHTQAYVLGLEKLWVAGPGWVRLQAELTHLQEQRPLENPRGVPVWYTHPNGAGYTHDGQMLGASIGPGGDAQFVGVDVFTGWGRLGGFVERIRRNDAYYWAVDEFTEPQYPAHDVELVTGGRAVWLVGGFELGAQLARSKRTNRDFSRINLPGLQASATVAYPATVAPVRSPAAP